MFERPETDSHEYIVNHRRVRRVRGNAILQKCVECGGRAEQWAWIHGQDPEDPANYQPMCRKDHKAYDRPDWLVEERREERERIESGRSHKGWTPERREAQRKRMLAKWSDPEERAKQADRAARDMPWTGRRSGKGDDAR